MDARQLEPIARRHGIALVVQFGVERRLERAIGRMIDNNDHVLIPRYLAAINAHLRH